MSTKHHSPSNRNTFFVRGIHIFFAKSGNAICAAPWTFVTLSTLLTVLTSIMIPLTEMVNNISDFTPYGARSREELKTYQQFFSDRGEPKVIYAFVTPKNGTNLLGVPHLNDTIRVLDHINNDVFLATPEGKKNFLEFCRGFCQFNEPVRAFAKGLLLFNASEPEGASHIDLGYPVTTVLGRKLYMDPNFFGVKIAVADSNGVRKVVDIGDSKTIINEDKQIPNNIRELNLIVLHFRAEIGEDIKEDALKAYEKEIVDHFQRVFHSDFVSVDILTDNFITTEIVRAGLSLLPFLVVGFIIMATFSMATFAMSSYVLSQWNWHKATLAIMACVTPFMACGTSMGIMFWCGFRFGSILCVTPFLVLAIGVDDAYLMMNAWQRITHERRKHNPYASDREADLRERIKEMLIETGPSVSITTITNMLAFGIGALTPTPEIQLFSIGNAAAVIVDFVYTITIYGALMAIVGRSEIAAEHERMSTSSSSTNCLTVEGTAKTDSEGKSTMNKILTTYCNLISHKLVILGIIATLALYWYISIVGTLNIKAELDPNQLFLKDSDIVNIFHARRTFIAPNYASCWVLVNNPGDIRNPKAKEKLYSLVGDFEALPPALGPYSTKFFLRDFDDFISQSSGDQMDYEVETSEEDGGSGTTSVPKRDDLAKFLSWPEFSFWKGFVQTNNTEEGLSVERFFFTTAFHGKEYVDWSRRAVLLNEWRTVADKYPQLNITVYEDDGKFLDIIETMVGTTAQSALFTFISMFLVSMMFISHPPTLFVATFSIISTSIGVFGIVSWWGVDLDPILMSATVMSIGFSVDIPAHISYHYFQTAKESSSVVRRLELTVSAVGFPILQASISTILCVLSLFAVQVHMAQVFAKTMLLVVVIGMIHGLIVIPVVFSLISFVPSKKISAQSQVSPVVFAVNQN